MENTKPETTKNLAGQDVNEQIKFIDEQIEETDGYISFIERLEMNPEYFVNRRRILINIKENLIAVRLIEEANKREEYNEH